MDSKYIVTRIAWIFWGVFFIYLYTQYDPYKTADTYNFYSFCRHLLPAKSEEGYSAITFCGEVNNRFFGKAEGDYHDIKPVRLKGHKFPVDQNIRYVLYSNPFVFTAHTYCYRQYKGWFPEEPYSVNRHMQEAASLPVFPEDIPKYKKWLRGYAGENCLREVKFYMAPDEPAKIDSLVSPAEMKGYSFLVAMNFIGITYHLRPWALKLVLDKFKLQLNRERVRGVYYFCEAVRTDWQARWIALTNSERLDISDDNKGPNWADEYIAGREYLVLTHEVKPKKFLVANQECVDKVEEERKKRGRAEELGEDPESS